VNARTEGRGLPPASPVTASALGVGAPEAPSGSSHTAIARCQVWWVGGSLVAATIREFWIWILG
jgi:hypothetical protein